MEEGDIDVLEGGDIELSTAKKPIFQLSDSKNE